jgi:D-methionine transport system substrate-binding protein
VLLLLRDKGILKLKDNVGYKPTVLDIIENPKRLKIVEADAAQTPRMLDEVDVAAVNTLYRPGRTRSRQGRDCAR